MIFQDGSCSEWYPKTRKPTLSTFFRAVVLHLKDLPRKRRDMSWHVQGRVKPKHDSCTTRLSWPARTAYDGQGNNGGIDALNTWKEHEGTNCTQWISMNFNDIRLVDIGCLICLLLLHANVQHLRAQKKLQLAKIPQLSVGFTCKSEQRQCQHLDRSLAWTRHEWI